MAAAILMKHPEIANMRPPGSAMERGLKAFVATLPVNCMVAEVGCFGGASTRIFLSRCSRIVCVDPWSDYVEKNEGGPTYHMIGMGDIEKHFERQFVHEIGIGKVIKCKMPSVGAAIMVRRIFDVVYLDGNHELESILEDISAWWPKVKPSGIISGHDFDRPSVRQAVEQLLGEPDDVFDDNTWSKRL